MNSACTAALAAAALDVEVGQIVKSLVFLKDGEPVLVLCAGDRRVDTERLGSSSVASAERVRACTRFGPNRWDPSPWTRRAGLPTTIDESLRRFSVVWAAAGTPHDVFSAVGTEALIAAIPGAHVTAVS